MHSFNEQRRAIAADGFTVLPPLYSEAEVASLLAAIDAAGLQEAGRFAVRRFLHAAPACRALLMTPALRAALHELFGEGYRLVKAIYFDKPPAANWFVAGHQDLTIAVKERAALPGFGPWTRKEEQWAVQPPLQVLENNFTLRIHLDDTDAENGALRVRAGSHRQGILRADAATGFEEVLCPVARGGALLMRPLLWHASSRSATDRPRRVLHLEFSDSELPPPLQWAEELSLSGTEERA
ncbi:phytanoyl-CoA dioxygenase family protein [Flaviaesturariibacter amylovorans]|uniref:Phytanoyl-CoA dioxygenase family protein n=1 Tax=Flaviaesturariibacter amylovorans TaxID=1084520 RepID=A0ABP8H8S1_9BACT